MKKFIDYQKEFWLDIINTTGTTGQIHTQGILHLGIFDEIQILQLGFGSYLASDLGVEIASI